MLFILLLASIPPSRPLVDRVDLLEINMFYDPRLADANGEVDVRTQILFWEVGGDGELRIVDWRWWHGEGVERDAQGRLKMIFLDGKTNTIRIVFVGTYIATLTAFDPEQEDRRKRGAWSRRKLSAPLMRGAR